MKRSILIATGNLHKVREIKALLGPGLEFQTMKDFPNAPVPVEDAATFEGNATKKAVTLARWLAGCGTDSVSWVLADDSGLEVDALNGAPGVHSARFAAQNQPGTGNSADADNNAKLLRLLAAVPPLKRTARFRCVIAVTPVPECPAGNASPVCEADEAELAARLFDGTCEGRIIDSPRGHHGFGYDPLFVPAGFEATYAELGAETKNRISHRSRALMKLKEAGILG